MESEDTQSAEGTKPTSLVLEDDKTLAEAYGRVLTSLGYIVILSYTVAHARSVIRDKAPDLMLIDIDLPDGNGLDLMNELRNDTRGRFVVISGNSSQRAAIKSIRHCAVELLIKPVSLNLLRDTLKPNALSKALPDSLTNDDCWIKFGNHPSLVTLRTNISYCAEHGRGHALITGQSGVEKPAVAREVHRRGRRVGQCIVVDCSLEKGKASVSRMFGQEDPETGEIIHAGYIDQAIAGTLVLDYVDHLSKEMQSRLMPLLDSGQFRRVDGVQGVRATLALVGISRESKTADQGTSNLRSDFLYRLAQSTLYVPSLSECADDVEQIACYILGGIQNHDERSRQFSDMALEIIRNNHWPRNVRELRSVIQRSVNAMQSDMPVELIALSGAENTQLPQSAISPWVGCTVWEMEKLLLEATLQHYNGDKEMTAKTLGMSLKTLYNRINAY